MSDQPASIHKILVHTQEEGLELMDKLANVASNETVYSRPATYGAHTIITASEVMSGLGYGFGGGEGSSPQEAQETATSTPEAAQAPDVASGMGGGGGGYSAARPVAVISIGPDGVEVKPVIDITKLAVAALTAGAGMLLAISRIARSAD